MKKLTLTLANRNSEQEYFKFRLNTFLTTFNIMQLSSLLYFLIVIIDTAIHGVSMQFYVSLGWELFCSMQFFLVKKINTRLITICLCLSSIAMGLSQPFIITYFKNPNNVFLLSHCLCLLQVELALSHKVIETVVTLLAIMLTKILIAYFMEGLLIGEAALVLTQLFSMYRTYTNEKQRRSSFLIEQIQQEWDRELDNTFTNNFISCQFDYEKFKFIAKKINREAQMRFNINSQERFVKFLRDLKTDKYGHQVSLEGYLFSMVEQITHGQVSEQVFGYFVDQTDSCLKINISLTRMTDCNFILIIEDDKIQNQLKNLKRQCSELRGVYKYLMFTTLKLLQQVQQDTMKRIQLTNKIMNINYQFKSKIGLKLKQFRLDRLLASAHECLNKPTQVLVLSNRFPLIVKQDPKLIVHLLINLMDLKREITFLNLEVNEETNTILFRLTNVVRKHHQPKMISEERVTYYKQSKKLDVVKKILKEIGPSDEIVIQRQTQYMGHVLITFEIYWDLFKVKRQLKKKKFF